MVIFISFCFSFFDPQEPTLPQKPCSSSPPLAPSSRALRAPRLQRDGPGGGPAGGLKKPKEGILLGISRLFWKCFFFCFKDFNGGFLGILGKFLSLFFLIDGAFGESKSDTNGFVKQRNMAKDHMSNLKTYNCLLVQSQLNHKRLFSKNR